MQKQDLDQIAKLVRKIVREEVEAEVGNSSNNLESQIRLSKLELKNDIRDTDNRMKNIEIKVNNVSKDVIEVKKSVRNVEKTVSIIARNYDEGDVMLAKRIEKLENHLNFSEEN